MMRGLKEAGVCSGLENINWVCLWNWVFQYFFFWSMQGGGTIESYKWLIKKQQIPNLARKEETPLWLVQRSSDHCSAVTTEGLALPWSTVTTKHAHLVASDGGACKAVLSGECDGSVGSGLPPADSCQGGSFTFDPPEENAERHLRHEGIFPGIPLQSTTVRNEILMLRGLHNLLVQSACFLNEDINPQEMWAQQCPSSRWPRGFCYKWLSFYI